MRQTALRVWSPPTTFLPSLVHPLGRYPGDKHHHCGPRVSMQEYANQVLAQRSRCRRSAGYGGEVSKRLSVGYVSAARREMSTAARLEWRAERVTMGKKECMRHNDWSQRCCGSCKHWTIVKCSRRKTYFVGKDRWLELWKPCGRKAQAAT